MMQVTQAISVVLPARSPASNDPRSRLPFRPTLAFWLTLVSMGHACLSGHVRPQLTLALRLTLAPGSRLPSGSPLLLRLTVHAYPEFTLSLRLTLAPPVLIRACSLQLAPALRAQTSPRTRPASRLAYPQTRACPASHVCPRTRACPASHTALFATSAPPGSQLPLGSRLRPRARSQSDREARPDREVIRNRGQPARLDRGRAHRRGSPHLRSARTGGRRRSTPHCRSAGRTG